MPVNTEQRVTILLDLLGREVSDLLLDDLPSDRGEDLRRQLKSLREVPPPDHEVEEVLDEFERFYRFAVNTLPDVKESDEPKNVNETHAVSSVDELNAPSDDPLDDLKRISAIRLAAALRGESPKAIAMILDRVGDEHAAKILESLPDADRNAAFLLMQEKSTAPADVILRLARAVVVKSLSITEEELARDEDDAEARMARMLRAMDRTAQFAILENIEATDAEAAARIRNRLYVFDDLLRLEDRSLQLVLGEVDSRTLAMSLFEAVEEIKDRVLGNLSRRARETLEEELDLLGSINDAEVQGARKSVVDSIAKLDKQGDLQMSR